MVCPGLAVVELLSHAECRGGRYPGDAPGQLQALAGVPFPSPQAAPRQQQDPERPRGGAWLSLGSASRMQLMPHHHSCDPHQEAALPQQHTLCVPVRQRL